MDGVVQPLVRGSITNDRHTDPHLHTDIRGRVLVRHRMVGGMRVTIKTDRGKVNLSCKDEFDKAKIPNEVARTIKETGRKKLFGKIKILEVRYDGY